MIRISRIAHGVLACLLLASGGGPAVATQKLAAGRDAMYAIRGGDVLMLDERGALLARCARFSASPKLDRHPPIGMPDPSETLRLAGLPDDDSTLAAEEALEDEAPSRPRRQAGDAAPAPLPRALAPDDDGVWIATSEGLYRGGTAGCRRIALPGRDLVAVATDGTAVVTATRGWLFRGRLEAPESLTFGPPIALAGMPRALAVDRQGGVLIAGDGGLLRVGAEGETALLLDRPTEALAACGPTVLVLSDDGVVLWDGRSVTRVAARPPVKDVSCSGSPQGWVAGGVGVWSSMDAVAWTEHPEGLGLDVSAVAVLAGVPWVVAGGELAPLQPQPGLPSAAWADPEAFPARRDRTRAPPAWRLPLVTASLLVDLTPLRRTVTGMVLFTFPWGRAPGHGADASEVAWQELQRDAALSRAQVALSQAEREAVP
ncbi:MAG TPA: hypothetical protein VMT03_08595 [Polyangia bacterium]|nr:hypothetical protein [Polyangia bacterium]